MKKIIFYLTLLCFFISNCKPKKEEEATIKKSPNEPPINCLAGYRQTPQDSVGLMFGHYIELVEKNPEIGIQQINTDAQVFKGLIRNVLGVKLINAADLKSDDITIYLQFWSGGENFCYYDIKQFFNPSQPGMRKQPVLCPPPDACDLPGVIKDEMNIITEKEAKAMAQHYNDLIKNYPNQAIEQVTMDAKKLDSLFNGTEGFKLVYAADMNTDKITVILQLWKKGVFSYYDINRFFYSSQPGMRSQPPLCPPPGGCDLPIFEKYIKHTIKKDSLTKKN